ncbi:hypothetical protein PACTADRAFT_48169 [Pachysolen tannophilus NRRL Y-2460]|uniref:Uncharacterized protein n=1 Tax=Pachysolen tannophilus NRRL Y-2460 TaxID=669874 RepID=A0A1E4U314_PACTA|nr:hypothetical protein PACTADRAFT_48169 [Pachysolen tannophilus NRRL Y-2460]
MSAVFERGQDLKQRGNDAFAKGKFKEAAELYGHAIKIIEDNPVLYSNRSICFIRLQEYDNALRDCNQGLRLVCQDQQGDSKSTKIKLLYRKGLALINLKRLQEAQECLEEGLNLDKNNTAIKNELAKLHGDRGKYGIQTKKLKRDTVLNSGLLKIPIVEVDRIPIEFTPNYNRHEEISRKKLEEMDTKDYSEETHNDLENSKLNSKYLNKLTPSILSSITLCSFQDYLHIEKIQIVNYLFSKDPLIYKDIFNNHSRSGIDDIFLKFFLDCIKYRLSMKNTIDEKLKIIQYLKIFTECRRFNLSKLMLSNHLIDEVFGLIKDPAITESDALLKSWR